MKNIIVGQSGGPTAVINASLAGVICEAKKHAEIGKIYGMQNGIEGFLKDRFVDLGVMSAKDLELLKVTPSAHLGSCRYKLPKELDDEVYKRLFEKFDDLDIGYVLYTGGNDSMDTADKLSRYAKIIGSDIKFIGIPKTIDNDLVGTDHTPGFGSAAKFVANTVRNITLDAEVYDRPSVTIVEIMGRNSGWLTAASVVARRYKGDNPVLIYLPEVAFSIDKFFEDVKRGLEKTRNLVICVSEGIKDINGKFICEYEQKAGIDNFGHKNLTGCGKFLEDEIKDRLGIKARSVEFNIVQRCATSLISKADLNEAFCVGAEGVKAALNGETAKMICIIRDGDYSVRYTAVDVNEISNKEKTFPEKWIIDGNDIDDEFFEYILPLISGEVNIPYKNGMAESLTNR